MTLLRTTLALCLVGSSLGACCRTPCGPPKRAEGIPTAKAARECRPGTAKQQQTIRELIQQIPSTQGAERIELGRLIVAFGEPAIPQLVAALGDPSSETRSAAAWMLGFMGDPRAADPLFAATRDPDKYVRLEAASSLLKLQDRRGLDPIIQGLDDGDPRVRAKCIGLLEQATGETFEYRADLGPSDRSASVSRWRRWAAQQRATTR